MPLSRIYRCSVHAALLACMSAGTADAQQKSPNFIVIRVDQVRPGMNTDSDAFQKEISGYYKQAKAPWRMVLTSAFGQLGTLVSITPIESLGELDGTPLVEKTAGPEKYASVVKRSSSIHSSSRRMIAVPQADLEIAGPRKSPPKYAVWTEFTIAPGRMDDFIAYWKNDLLPAYKKAGVETMYVARFVFGRQGGGGFVTARLISSMAELDGGPVLRKAMDAGAYSKTMAKGAGIINSTSSSIFRVRTDLGYEPAAQGSGN